MIDNLLTDKGSRIERQKVLSYLGYKRGSITPLIPSLDLLLSQAGTLLRPATYCVVSEIVSVDQGGKVQFDNDIRLKAPILKEKFNRGQKGLFFLATLGSGLETRVSGFLQRGLCLEALLLDAAGWVSLQGLIRDLKKSLASEGTLDFTLIPGLKGFPLEMQKEIFSLFSKKETGISLTEECMMVPKKSLSGIMIFH